ncbi:hypothetical protein F9278_32365 [Streptomyces phaeolivaceus]|uniref:Uncharacterized protein n=1 Tax=Streptomyces phaeolivaceus TaxID=2653200 RepID=A0A5P8K9U2_9ACTN|nr:hypothetical protein [Streptomyces phaeolivaceus]QFR00074.1 hypothetical protein F9278_32365 [Streptomyces phaeolivaceus]
MIEPAGIPQFTGDFGQLEKDVTALRVDASGISNAGADVHSRFQALGAYYIAPEADDLFATTEPVMSGASSFAEQLEDVADALETYCAEARPPAERLARLQQDAYAFVESVDGDDEWTHDEDKVERHQKLLDDVAAAEAAFRAAERRTASTISALVGGPKFVADDGSHTVNGRTVMYGYDLGALRQAEELPWGSPVEESHHAWELGHWGKTLVWDGIYKDNIEPAVTGLYDLATFDGEAWGGVRDVLTGIGVYTITPYDAFMDWAIGPDEESADEVRGKQAAKEFAKGLVAWDTWEENPVRASGTVIFNAFTLGAGSFTRLARGAEAGSGVAKGAGAAAKIGEYLDPVSAALKVGGKTVDTIPRLSDITARLSTSLGASTGSSRATSVLELDDGSKVRIEDGEFIHVDRDGNVVSDTGPREESAAERGVAGETAERQPEFAGVGGGGSHEATGHGGGNSASEARHGPSHSSAAGRGNDDSSPARNTAGHSSDSGDSSGNNRHSAVPSEGASLGSERGGGSNSGAGQGDTPSGGGTPPPAKEWQAGDDVIGPARGKTLLYPNSRHDLSGVRSGRPDTENTVILPETKEKVRQDIAEIAAGRAQFDPHSQRYAVNGRRYVVEPHGRIFPVDGPGLVPLNRVEYTALKSIMRVDGDMSKLQTMFSKDPKFSQNPQAIETALALYRKYYS